MRARIPWGIMPVAALLAVLGCGEEAPVQPCNGHVALCGRPLNQVALATTHNSMANAQEGWIAPNHKYPVSRQLADGVRALMLDLHLDRGKVSLCHSSCGLGSKLLLDQLKQLKQFIEANPREVLVLIFESYVKASVVAQAFTDAGLLPVLHTQSEGLPWPTLGQMISSGRRMVVLTDRSGGDPAWYHYVWSHAWETHWAAKSPQNLSCKRNRGKAGNSLFIFNHFLTNPIALELLAQQVNHDPLFIDRARRCQKESGRLPNFITVDFYATGDLMKVVKALNRLQ